MTLLLTLVPAFLVLGLVVGSGSDPDDLDAMPDEDMGDEGTSDDLMDAGDHAAADLTDFAEADSLQLDDLPPAHHDVAFSGASTAPAVLSDFRPEEERLEIQFDDDLPDGELDVVSLDGGASSAVTLDGVRVVVLEGVRAESVSLSRTGAGSGAEAAASDVAASEAGA